MKKTLSVTKYGIIIGILTLIAGISVAWLQNKSMSVSRISEQFVQEGPGTAIKFYFGNQRIDANGYYVLDLLALSKTTPSSSSMNHLLGADLSYSFKKEDLTPRNFRFYTEVTDAFEIIPNQESIFGEAVDTGKLTFSILYKKTGTGLEIGTQTPVKILTVSFKRNTPNATTLVADNGSNIAAIYESSTNQVALADDYTFARCSSEDCGTSNSYPACQASSLTVKDINNVDNNVWIDPNRVFKLAATVTAQSGLKSAEFTCLACSNNDCSQTTWARIGDQQMFDTIMPITSDTIIYQGTLPAACWQKNLVGDGTVIAASAVDKYDIGSVGTNYNNNCHLSLLRSPSAPTIKPSAAMDCDVDGEFIRINYTDIPEAVGYIMERKTGTTGTYAAVGTYLKANGFTTGTIVVGLGMSVQQKPNTQYCYRMRAMGKADDTVNYLSPYSNEYCTSCDACTCTASVNPTSGTSATEFAYSVTRTNCADYRKDYTTVTWQHDAGATVPTGTTTKYTTTGIKTSTATIKDTRATCTVTTNVGIELAACPTITAQNACNTRTDCFWDVNTCIPLTNIQGGTTCRQQGGEPTKYPTKQALASSLCSGSTNIDVVDLTKYSCQCATDKCWNGSACLTPASTCTVNGYCEAGETAANCSADCGSTIPCGQISDLTVCNNRTDCAWNITQSQCVRKGDISGPVPGTPDGKVNNLDLIYLLQHWTQYGISMLQIILKNWYSGV